MTDKIRLASVGLGRWSRVLANGAQRGDTIELVSCFSRDEKRRQDFMDEYGIPRGASSYEELLADPEVEGVLITTPNDTHRELIIQALEAGKAAYTDKPIAHTLEHGVAIVEAVESTGLPFAVGHSARRLGGSREMKRWIDDGRLGKGVDRGGELLERARSRADPRSLALLPRQDAWRRDDPARRAPCRQPPVSARAREVPSRRTRESCTPRRTSPTSSCRCSSSSPARSATSARAGRPRASTP